jgi:prevent-host-death family protein|tara:strand:+ start:660 stop:1166 length:507 start_codon:yes stop_codon:yes gene_type:complete
VLGLLYGQSERSFFGAEVINLLGMGSGGVQRELKKLADSGLVRVFRVLARAGQLKPEPRSICCRRDRPLVGFPWPQKETKLNGLSSGGVMDIINMHDAKTRLSQLVDKAAKGEPFIIAKAGKPVARVTAVDAPEAGKVRRLGFLKGQMQVPEDFDRLGETEIADSFEG